MRKTVAILLAVSLLLCACAKTEPPAQSAAAPADSSAGSLSLPKVNEGESESAQSAANESAVTRSEPSSAAGKVELPPLESESETMRMIRLTVPYAEEYLQEGILVVEQDEGSETVELAGEDCPIVTLIGSDGDPASRRQFAYSHKIELLHEYDPAAPMWYNRWARDRFLTLEDFRNSVLSSGNYLVCYSYIGTRARIELPDDLGFSYLSGFKIADAAYMNFPFLRDVDTVIEGHGDEYYMIVPADPMATVSVNRMEGGDVAEVLYRSETGDPIIITSDMMTDDIRVVVVGNGGRSITFRPEMSSFANDEQTRETALNLGSYECLPMFGSSQVIIDMLLQKMPEYAEGGWELEIVPDRVEAIHGRPCWLIDCGYWYGNEFHTYDTVAISEDYRHVYYQEGDGWKEVLMEQPVRAEWASTMLQYIDDYDTFTVSETEPVVDVMFIASEGVRDFKVLSLMLTDWRDDGTPVFDETELYYQEWLGEKPLLVQMTFYGDIPNNGISFTDQNGVFHSYTVSVSGRDGELELTEYDGAKG